MNWEKKGFQYLDIRNITSESGREIAKQENIYKYIYIHNNTENITNL